MSQLINTVWKRKKIKGSMASNPIRCAERELCDVNVVLK